MDSMNQIEFLNAEREKIWERLTRLERELKKKTSDFEAEAKQSSKKASEYRNRSSEARDEAERLLEEIKSIHSNISSYEKSGQEISEQTKTKFDSIQTDYAEIQDRKNTVVKYVENLETVFEEHPQLKDEFEELTSKIEEGENYHSKVKTLHKAALTKKKEIDELYYEINGYVQTDEETGEETEVDGLRAKLEKSYSSLEKKVEEIKGEYGKFTGSVEVKFKSTVSTWKKEHTELVDQIQSLLPNALTAGLSAAYSDKKKDEETEKKKYQLTFLRSIYGLVAVSIIPFAMSTYLLTQGKELNDVILQMPRIVLSILPLYIPVLWVAYSSSKKVNLSKRLIEEYAHKEVLSKTYEGLSKQIENIQDKKSYEELKHKLLYSVLDVSAENPGKLISDYNNSDHPLMDALDKSVKLANAVNVLERIPGLSKVAKMVDNKSKKALEEEAKKVETGMGIVAAEEDDDKK